MLFQLATQNNYMKWYLCEMHFLQIVWYGGIYWYGGRVAQIIGQGRRSEPAIKYDYREMHIANLLFCNYLTYCKPFICSHSSSFLPYQLGETGNS